MKTEESIEAKELTVAKSENSNMGNNTSLLKSATPTPNRKVTVGANSFATFVFGYKARPANGDEVVELKPGEPKGF